MRISRKSFDRIVEEAIAELPEDFAQWLEEVPVIVEDRPGKSDQAEDSDDEEAVGLYTGHSRAERSVEHSGDLPPRIMIYRIPLMDACETREQLSEEIRKTLLHELGHHAGLDEEALDRLGYGDMEEEEIEWDVEDDESEGPK